MFRLLMLACALAQANPRQAAQPTALPFLRNPDIHGDRVVFTCEGDLWLGDIGTGKAVRLTRDDGVESDARFSPDGTQLAFTASYDGPPEVYVMPAGGGAPRRVTYQNTQAQVIAWTADGKSIVFRSRDEFARPAAFVVPAAGGAPKRLPLEFVGALTCAPDGQRFAFNRYARADEAWFRYTGGRRNDVWVGRFDASATRPGPRFRRIVTSAGTNEFPAWAGERICFAREDNARFTIHSVKPDGTGDRTLCGPYDVEVRNLHSDGKRLVFERGAALELCDLATGNSRDLRFDLASDMTHAMPFFDSAGAHIFGAALGPTGKRVLVETRGQVISVPAKDGDTRVLLARDGARFRHPAFSPDAKHVAYVSDETREQQLYVADADGAHPKQLTTDSGRQLNSVTWSPDGKWLAVGDSDAHLRLVDAATGKATDIGQGAWWRAPEFTFSPDSRWLVYVARDPVTTFGRLTLYEIASGKRTTLTNGLGDDFAPAFSRDGKWLAFLSHRHIAPRGDDFLNQLDTDDSTRVFLLALKKDTRSPLLPDDDEETPAADKPAEKKPEAKSDAKPEEKPAAAAPRTDIDLDGLYDRSIELPIAAGGYQKVEVVGDRVLLASIKPGGPNPTQTLTWYDLKQKKGGTVADGFEAMELSADGKRLLLYAGANSRVIDATAQTASPTDGRLDFASFPLRIDPRAEWAEMYWDAWRLLRDYFYVPNLHGADWPAIGAKYAKLLPSVRSRDELNELIRWLQSELTISHAFRSAGDVRPRPAPFSPAPSFLGIDVEPDPGGSGYLRITNVLRGDGFSDDERSPLAAPGLNVKEGDYLIEVGGISVKDSGYPLGLVGRAGKVVAIKVNDRPTPDGARTVRVKPVANEARMRYVEWVRRRRDYVTKLSGGRIGYLHLRAMMNPDMADFIRQYFPQRGKDALIVDVRYNTGGYVSAFINTILKQKVDAFWNQRGAPAPWTRQSDYFAGPMACIINEFNYSDGEEFPHEFKSKGLGPLIGKRTAGAEVGSDPGWPLADGGRVYVPDYGAWTPKDGWIIEGHGVAPDIEVDNDPNLWAEGKDPQLDRAVEVLLADLKMHPVVRPAIPAPPVKIREAGR